MPDIDYGKLADELLPKKEKAERDCQGYLECYADGKNGTIDDCKPVVIKLLKEIDKLKAGSIEVGVEEIEEIIETWFVKQESILSNEQIKEVDTKGVWQVDLKSLSFDEIKKGLAQAILNNNKEKE